jgi:cell division septal protein FtsQ
MALAAYQEEPEDQLPMAPAPPPPVARGEEGDRPFRRREVIRQHRRKKPYWQFLRLMFRGVLVAAVPVALLAWGLTTSQLGLQEVRVEDGQRVSAAWVREALEPWMGRNLLQIPLSALNRRLAKHPWLEGASLEKRLPNGLEVRILEKVPVALAQAEDRRYFVDSRGEVITAVQEGEETSELPVIRGARRAPRDIAAALRVSEEFFQLGLGHVQEVQILGDDDFRLLSADWPLPLVVSFGSLTEKKRHLVPLMAAIASRGHRVGAVDLRFAQRIVLKPEDEDRGAATRSPKRG